MIIWKWMMFLRYPINQTKVKIYETKKNYSWNAPICFIIYYLETLNEKENGFNPLIFSFFNNYMEENFK